MSRKRGLCRMSRDGRLSDILMYSWYAARAAQSKFLMLRSHPFTETLDKENISESYEKLSGGRKWGRRCENRVLPSQMNGRTGTTLKNSSG